jgi:hypothetical protein
MKKLLLLSMLVVGLQLGLSAQTTLTATISVGQDPLLTADAGNDQTASPGDTVTLGATTVAAGGSGTYTYEWTPTAGVDDSSLANPSYVVGTSDVTFTVEVTDSKNCVAADNANVRVSTISVNETEKARFFVYPNPVSTELHIQGLENASKLNAILADVNGKILLDQRLNDGESKLDVSSLSPGVYTLTVSSEADEYQTKIVIE